MNVWRFYWVNRKQKLVSIALCVCLIAGMMAGCGQPETEEVSGGEARAAISVQTETPSTGSLALSTKFVGTVEPAESVYVFPKSSGEVVGTYYNVGDRVNQGDILFVMDDTYIQLSVEAAQAQYEATEAQIAQQLGSQMDLNILQAKSAYEQAKNAFRQTRDSYDDTEDSIDDGLDAYKAAYSAYYQQMQGINEELKQLEKELDDAGDDAEKSRINEEIREKNWEYKEAKSNYDDAYAEYKKLKSSEDSTLDQLETAKDNAKLGLDTATESFEITSNKVVEEAKASATAQLNALATSMKTAVKQLEDTRVTSPISGVIEMKSVDVHDMASSSNPAYVVSNKESMTVTFNVSATAVADMETGDPVTVTSGNKEYAGAITEISTMVDQQSGLFKVKASVENAQDLYTGMTVTLTANTQKAKDAMIIPLSAVYYDAGKPYVYINENNVAVKTYIETGIDDNQYIEVLSGLSPSSLVVTSWDTNLIDGALLAVSESSSPDGEEAPEEAGEEEQPGAEPAQAEQPADSQPSGN